MKTALQQLNQIIGTNKDVVAQQFDRWVNAGGKVNKGLEGRRKAEKQLFLT